jgi:dTDP-4-dehydrorhamnose reductase
VIEHRILVTGSGGQLGSELCRQLGPGAVGLDLADLDITDRDAVFAAVDRHRPDIVINAAAFTHVDRAELEPEACRAVNLQGVENLVAACRASGSIIVQISTDYVFDGQKTTPYTETDRPNPLNAYGHAKWEAEQAVAKCRRHLIVRTAGLFGRGGSTASGNFVDTMLRLARQGQRLRVVDDQITSFTCTSDLASGIRSLLAAETTGLFHLTNAGYASWYQLAVEVFRIAGLRPCIEPIPIAKYACHAKRPRFSALCIEKYNAVPGRHPMPTWKQAVAGHLTGRRNVCSC